MTIAYLGDEYSHSFAAAEAFGGASKRYPTIRAALTAVGDGAADRAVVPIENSLEGSVRETLDGLNELSLYIRAERTLPIRQNLIGLVGAETATIKRIYSHPQALAQCRPFIDSIGAEAIPVGSTSEGLLRIRAPEEGAIARVPRPGQAVLAAGVESGDNRTRFVLVAKTPDFTGDKVSVAFETRNKPGALLAALEVFRDFGLNMVRIESRPAKNGLGRYIFFADFTFSGAKEELMRVFGALSGKTAFLKFLGKYDTEAL